MNTSYIHVTNFCEKENVEKIFFRREREIERERGGGMEGIRMYGRMREREKKQCFLINENNKPIIYCLTLSVHHSIMLCIRF